MHEHLVQTTVLLVDCFIRAEGNNFGKIFLTRFWSVVRGRLRKLHSTIEVRLLNLHEFLNRHATDL